MNVRSAMTTLSPATPEELAEIVRSTPRLIPIGAGTKPRLAAVPAEYVRVSTAGLSGLVEYEPSEFTFTARAGTPLREIVAALAERGQYLPFDPLLVKAGATLGGTIAAGLSGPGRMRYGGLRDFILGIRFVDGEGRLLRLGGRVVKNAAGFDVPKFLVGSAGRFGVLVEATFKVFPRPPARRTLRLHADDFAAKTRILGELGRSRFELDAIDAPLEEPAVFVRIAAPAEALDALAGEILARSPGETLSTGEGDYLWQSVTELRWAHAGGVLAKVSLTLPEVASFAAAVRAKPGARAWVSAGGNVGYVSAPKPDAFPEMIWPGVTLRGDAPLWLGPQRRFDTLLKVKAALDRHGRFPGLDT